MTSDPKGSARCCEMGKGTPKFGEPPGSPTRTRCGLLRRASCLRPFLISFEVPEQAELAESQGLLW